MAQETIPKYEYFIVHLRGMTSDVESSMEAFNAKIETMVEKGGKLTANIK